MGLKQYMLAKTADLSCNKTKPLARTALEGSASYRGSYAKEFMKNRRRRNKWLRIYFSAWCEGPETTEISEHYAIVAR